jgi:hypothetical protein
MWLKSPQGQCLGSDLHIELGGLRKLLATSSFVKIEHCYVNCDKKSIIIIFLSMASFDFLYSGTNV